MCHLYERKGNFFLYYFYNQFLESILTAERWATAKDLKCRPHSFLSTPTLAGGKEVLQRLKVAFGKENVKYIILLKEDRAKKTSKWPVKMPNSKANATIIVANHGAFITHLLQNEGGLVQLRESSSLFPLPNGGGPTAPVVVEDVRIFDQVVPNVTVEVMPTVENIHYESHLDYGKLHRQFGKEKKITILQDDSKNILLRSSHSFTEYTMVEEMNEASALLTKVYQNIEEIFLHYGEELHRIDSQIEDELHYIEFSDANASHCSKAYKRLQELRVKRRCIKDSIQLAELMAQNLGSDLPQRMKQISEKINQWDERSYMVRVPEEFNH